QHDGRHLAHTTAPLSQKQLSQREGGQSAAVQVGQGGGGGHGVHVPQRQPVQRLGPVGHEDGEGSQQQPSGQGRIHKVLAQPAVELLDQNNGEGGAQNRDPIGGGGGQAEGQQQAGDAGGQIPYRIALAGEAAIAVLKQDT